MHDVVMPQAARQEPPALAFPGEAPVVVVPENLIRGILKLAFAERHRPAFQADFAFGACQLLGMASNHVGSVEHPQWSPFCISRHAPLASRFWRFRRLAEVVAGPGAARQPPSAALLPGPWRP